MLQRSDSHRGYARAAVTIAAIVAGILTVFLGVQKADNQLPQETVVLALPN